jgi:predicted transcriptional regulator
MRSLRTLAREQRVSVAELIRQSVDHFLHLSRATDKAVRQRRAIAAAGRFHSGHSGVSDGHTRI